MNTRLLSKIVTLLCLWFSPYAQAEGVKLCKPLSTSKHKDEIGGVFSAHRQEYIKELDRAASEENWLNLQSYRTNPPLNSCTRIAVVPTSTRFLHKNIFGHEPAQFLKALAVEKKNIMAFYKSEAAGDQQIEISDQEYNRIAFLAAGVLGAESGAGKSVWFFLEHLASSTNITERLAVCLTTRTKKSCTTKPLTSRGMTQIKVVPKIGEPYGINRDNLSDSYLAGVATVGFLIQEYKRYLGILRTQPRYYMAWSSVTEQRQKQEINKDDFEIFLTYIYRGDVREIYGGTATPDQSCYYKRVQKYQEYLRFYIIPDQDCSEAGVSILDKEN